MPIRLMLCLVFFLSWSPPALALMLAWNPSPGAAGYALHYGVEPGVYTTALDTGVLTTAAISGLTPGATYYFGALAYNEAGVSGYSNEVSYTEPDGDTELPSVAITAPADGSTVTRNARVTILLSASDDTGIASVEVMVNGSTLCTDTAPPYQCVWRVRAKKNVTYTLHARATDTSGNLGHSPIVEVTSQ